MIDKGLMYTIRAKKGTHFFNETIAYCVSKFTYKELHSTLYKFKHKSVDKTVVTKVLKVDTWVVG